MRNRLVCLDAGSTLLAPVRSLSEVLPAVLAVHGLAHARVTDAH